MSQPSTLAKTSRPSLAGVLARDRLFSVLDPCRRSSAVWVYGPPGCGKTTLVASYLGERQPDSRWYQIDAGDSDVATFFYYMARGMGDAAGADRPDLPDLPLFTAEYHDELPMFARHYFQTLYASLEAPFVLVLDNYQEAATQSALHRVVLEAVSEMPPEGSLIVLSRTEPPSSMARLRANREIEVVGWSALRLTREESDSIIDEWGESFSEWAREQIYEKTVGWAAGLILMLDQATADGHVQDIPALASEQLIFDYLAGEIFDNFDRPTRELLLRTAFLGEMTAEIAASVTGEPRAAEILAHLHRNYHLVASRPGDGAPVYQYHPLLSDFLRSRASASLEPDERHDLRRRACALLEAAGAIDDVVALLRDEDHPQELARVILEHAPEMLRLGRAETLDQWLEELPTDVLSDDPWFFYWRAACRFYTAPRDSRRLYERAFELFAALDQPDRRGMLLTCSGAMDAMIYELDDLSLLDPWITRASDLLDEASESQWPAVQARATVSLFISLVFRQPDHAQLSIWAGRAHESLPAIEDGNARLTAQLLIAITLNYTGSFARVRQFIAAMQKACRSPHVSPLAVKVLRDVESMYYMLTADHDRCLQAVYDGLETGRTSGVRLWSYHLLLNGAAGALAAGDLDTAEDLLGQLREFQESARRLDLCTYHYYSAWLAMLRGDPVTAFQQQKRAFELSIEVGCPFYEVLCRLAMAHVLFELGDERRAFAHLRRSRAIGRDIKNHYLEFSGLMMFAYIALRAGRRHQARNSLQRALECGRENGFNHFLWWQPEVLAKLCAWALEERIEVDYVRSLIRDRELMPEPAPVGVREWPWRFQIYTFDHFEVLKDGKRLGVQAKLQKKPVELLKALVGFGADNVQESRLAQSMWPRIDADSAHGSLTTTLHRLRKLVGEDRIIGLRHGRLSLDASLCWLDLRAFEWLTGEIDQHVRGRWRELEVSTVENLAERLLDIYRGPFMGSEGEHSRYVSMRGRLRNKFLRSLGELARFWEERDDWEHAALCFERGIDVDPTAEGLYRHLMICHRELDRNAEAVDVYDRLRSTLRAERDIDPSPETTSIYKALIERL